jgi:pyruvyl transferase EpsO
MDRLRDRVANLSRLIPQDRPLVYLDYPVHTNVGDLLIQLGTQRFFTQFNYDVIASRSAYDFDERLMRRIGRDVTIVLHGGGNFGDLYDQHQSFRERVIRRFPDNRIVMLPQTIHYRAPERMALSAQIFSQHQDLHVCLRDRHSLATFQANFANQAYLVPDMAHLLWRSFDFKAPGPGDTGTLLFLRTDIEATSPRVSENGEAPVDWQSIIRPVDQLMFRLQRKLHAKHHLVGGMLPLSALWQNYSERLIGRALTLMDGKGHVVTDRLHMALLGLLLRRRVTAIDNSYGKLSSYIDTWLAHHRDIEIRGSRRYAPETPQALARAAQ